MPLVSVLMPVRNEAMFLQDALSSLYRQSLMDWELIVVDDGSTDSTPRILETACRNDTRIRVLSSGGAGLVPSLNLGLAACSAPLVARMDGDDVNHPLRLEMQARYLADHPETDLVACGFRHFPRRSMKNGMRAYEDWQNNLATHEKIIRDLFVESPFVHPSIMSRTSLLIEVGGYRDMGWPEDYDIWLRLAAAGAHFSRLSETLFFWRDHPERATRTMAEYDRSAFRACKFHHLLHGYLKGIRQVVIAGAGLEGRAWQRLLAGAGVEVTRWVDVDPRRIGRTLHGAPVVNTDHLSPGCPPMLVAIGVQGARQQFRDLASEKGLVECSDYICVA